MNVCAWDNSNINEQYGIVNKFITELAHMSSKQWRLFHARTMITKQIRGEKETEEWTSWMMMRIEDRKRVKHTFSDNALISAINLHIQIERRQRLLLRPQVR
jgi:hypothetical protein